MAVGDGHDHGLHRREPERERTGVVLDQDADEALEGAEQRPVDHRRDMLGVVLAGIADAEPAGHLEVELDGAHLPRAADRVGHVQVDLRPVERAVARVQLEGDAGAFQRASQRPLGRVPHRVVADPLLGPSRQLDAQVEVEDAVDLLGQLQAADHLVLDLGVGAEDVGVVLGDVAHAHEAVQRSGRLVAVHETLLGQPQRQIAVAALAVGEQVDVTGAVHRLQAELAVLHFREVHVLAVSVPVPRGLPDLDVEEDRRAHLLVAALAVQPAPEVRQLVPDHHPAGVPERRPRGDVGEVEQVELAPQPPVVAQPRLLDPLEVGVELLLAEERGAVDAGQHRVGGIAAPVGACGGEQPEGLDRLGGLQVRAAAEILEAVLGVEADLALGEVAQQLGLVRLVLGLEPDQQLALVDPVAADERVLRAEDPAHLRLDAPEVVGRDRLGELEVVVEAVGDRRPDRDLRVRPQVQHGLRHDMRGRVAQDGERLRIAVGEDAHLLAVGHREPKVSHLAVHLHGDRRLRQPRADRGRGIEAGGAVCEVEVGAVGQGDVHGEQHIDRALIP